MDFSSDPGEPTGSLSFLFTLEDQAGSLSSCLNIFKRHDISLSHIESRPSRNFEWEHEFLVEFDAPPVDTLEKLKSDLLLLAKNIQLIGQHPDISSKGLLCNLYS